MMIDISDFSSILCKTICSHSGDHLNNNLYFDCITVNLQNILETPKLGSLIIYDTKSKKNSGGAINSTFSCWNHTACSLSQVESRIGSFNISKKINRSDRHSKRNNGIASKLIGLIRMKKRVEDCLPGHEKIESGNSSNISLKFNDLEIRSIDQESLVKCIENKELTIPASLAQRAIVRGKRIALALVIQVIVSTEDSTIEYYSEPRPHSSHISDKKLMETNGDLILPSGIPLIAKAIVLKFNSEGMVMPTNSYIKQHPKFCKKEGEGFINLIISLSKESKIMALEMFKYHISNNNIINELNNGFDHIISDESLNLSMTNMNKNSIQDDAANKSPEEKEAAKIQLEKVKLVVKQLMACVLSMSPKNIMTIERLLKEIEDLNILALHCLHLSDI